MAKLTPTGLGLEEEGWPIVCAIVVWPIKRKMNEVNSVIRIGKDQIQMIYTLIEPNLEWWKMREMRLPQ